jgi:hypothetical protein
MYVVLLILFPILLLFNTYLAMGALAAGIAAMYFDRTKPAKKPNREPDTMYTPGYE